MAPGSCERCGGTLIEVDSYGRVKLPDADVEALRKIQHPATP